MQNGSDLPGLDELAFYASTTAFASIDFEHEDIVPVFLKDDQMFNWNIPIRGFATAAL